jgi:hypothetical protein
MKSGRYQHCYANIPVTFASSPPKNIEKFNFLDEHYASNSIFIIDESALFLSGKHDEVKEIFAFPRKLNQVFLLASVLPTKQIKDYCHLFVNRSFNFSMIGFPMMSFVSGEYGQHKPPFHLILFYSRYFQYYASKFRPESMYPLEQWRDRGALYDTSSKRVPIQAVRFYVINSWGLGEVRKNLTDEETDLLNFYVPKFDVSYLDDNKIELPKLKQKRSLNFIGTDFNPVFFIQLIIVLYLTFIGISYFGNMQVGDPPPGQWGWQEFKNLARGYSLQYKDEAQAKEKETKYALPTETPSRIEWKIE